MPASRDARRKRDRRRLSAELCSACTTGTAFTKIRAASSSRPSSIPQYPVSARKQGVTRRDPSKVIKVGDLLLCLVYETADRGNLARRGACERNATGLGLGYGGCLVCHFAGWLSLDGAWRRGSKGTERRLRRPFGFHARYSHARWQVLLVLSSYRGSLDAPNASSNRHGLGRCTRWTLDQAG